MRRISAFVLGLVCALGLPAAAHAQSGQVQGFGGFTFGDVTGSSTFGGSIAVPLGDHVQIIGEAGRLTNLMSSLVDDVFDLTPLDVRVSAFYGEGGVRFIPAPQGAVRPYVEATAGVARLSTNIDGLGGAGEIIDSAMGFFGRTEPLVGAGGGVLIQGGPLVVDLGYRYKKILATHSIQAILTGSDMNVSQVRIGVGLRF